GGNGPEVAYLWTAPADGSYVFDTFGSAVDTVLYLNEGGTCEGLELVCNDLVGPESVTANLLAGETVYVVVDAWFADAEGNYNLYIDEAPACSLTGDLGEVLPAIAMGSVSGGAGEFTSTGCGGNGLEATYAWTAPADGTYTFDTAG